MTSLYSEGPLVQRANSPNVNVFFHIVVNIISYGVTISKTLLLPQFLRSKTVVAFCVWVPSYKLLVTLFKF